MASDKVSLETGARIAAFHAQMVERAQMQDDDFGTQVMEQQAERIFSAAESGDVAKILDSDMGGTIQGRDVPGTVWRIQGFRPVISNRTDLENAHGYYLSCDATYLGGPKDVATKNALIIGQEYALQTGAELAVFKLRALEAAEAFPVDVMVIGIKTSSGYQVIKLGSPPDMAVQAETA